MFDLKNSKKVFPEQDLVSWPTPTRCHDFFLVSLIKFELNEPPKKATGSTHGPYFLFPPGCFMLHITIASHIGYIYA